MFAISSSVLYSQKEGGVCLRQVCMRIPSTFSIP